MSARSWDCARIRLNTEPLRGRSWVSCLKCREGNDDDMLARSFLLAGRVEEKRADGVSWLVQGQARVPAKQVIAF